MFCVLRIVAFDFCCKYWMVIKRDELGDRGNQEGGVMI